MNAAENNIVQLLTSKPSMQDATVDELQAITSSYPYFSVGRFLFTQKIQQEQPINFDKQLQQCAIYFQDIQWLQGQLYNRKFAIPIPAEKIVQANFSHILLTKKNEDVSDKSALTTLPEKEKTEDVNLITLPAEDVLDHFSLQMNGVKDEPELPPLDEEELANNANDAAVDATAKIADVLQHQVEDFKMPVDAQTVLPISTEPYHTIDYFASQGIKADTQLQDAFLKKVHTFTDWLRQMKRISQHPSDLGSDPDMESYVQTIADSSNQPKAVDTEAMAEVLVKQGKLDKAIEVYQKLSLLNPAKTAYFAEKINQLKAS